MVLLGDMGHVECLIIPFEDGVGVGRGGYGPRATRAVALGLAQKS
jgi:hypothetical protein